MKSLIIGASIIAVAGTGIATYSLSQPEVEENEKEIIVEDVEPTEEGDLAILPAITAQNLQVFLITGDADLAEREYLTLESAMQDEKVRVKETGTVNQLTIDNNSDQYVFIHSGDIVKGGKQDRTIAHDVILPPGAKNIALESYCVESGRWQARENEDVGNFNSSTKMLSSKDLRLAAKYDNNQSKVWDNVTKEQEKLNHNVSQMNGYDVDLKSNVSATSLQLTLESEELEKAKESMQGSLLSLLTEHENAIGYAYAINGEIYGIDIYNNRPLFEEVWPKLVESIVIEAISNRAEEAFIPAAIQDVIAFMNAAEEEMAHEDQKAINDHTDLNIIEGDSGNVVFSTVDNEAETWVHKNYLKRSPNEVSEEEINPLLDNNYMRQIRN